MEYSLAVEIEGTPPVLSEPEDVRIEGSNSYAGQDMAWVAEDETQIKVSRQERIRTC